MSTYNQFSNNGQNKKSVTTRNTTLKNGDGVMMSSALVITYNDDMLRLEFTPELPENQKSTERRYDYQNNVVTAISRKNCNVLYKKYIEDFLPKLVAGEEYEVGIVVADVNLISIGTGVNVANDGVHPYIALYKNLSPDTLKPEVVMYYEFKPSEVIVNYNKETGSFGERMIVHSELDTFMEDMKSNVVAGSKAFIHQARVVDKTFKDAISDKLDKIGSKLGLDLSYKPNAGYNSGYGNVFNRQTNNSNYAPDQQSIDSFDDLPF